MTDRNQTYQNGRVSIHSNVQRGSAHRQTSFSGRRNARIKLPFPGHIDNKFRKPTIFQLNIEGLTASKMNVLFSPILTYVSAGWFPFSSPTHITSVERMHRSSCRVITGCLSSTLIPLLHIEALLPPLRVTLTHQSLSFFEQALRLPFTFPIASLANSNTSQEELMEILLQIT